MRTVGWTLFARDGESGSIFGPGVSGGSGSDPFAVAIHELEATISGTMPSWFRTQLLIFFVLFLVILFLHLAALVVPLFKGPESRSKHMWVFRLKHVGTYRHPYLVGNGRLFASSLSIVACILFIIQLAILLWAPGLVNSAYTSIPLIPLYLTLWLSVFDALFAIWITPVNRAPSWTDRLKHPWLLNPLCWVWPVIVTVVESVLISQIWHIFETLRQTTLVLIETLMIAEQRYKIKGLMGVDLPSVKMRGDDFSNAYTRYSVRQTYVLISWSVCFLIATILFFISLFLLVKTFYFNSVSPTSKRASSSLKPSQASSSTPARTDAAIVRNRQQQILLAYFGVLACIVLTFTALVAFFAHLSWTARHVGQGNGAYYQRHFVAIFWLIAIMFGSLGALSLFRVLDVAVPSSTRHPGPSSAGMVASVNTDGKVVPAPSKRVDPTEHRIRAGLFSDGTTTSAEDADEHVDDEEAAMGSGTGADEGAGERKESVVALPGERKASFEDDDRAEETKAE